MSDINFQHHVPLFLLGVGGGGRGYYLVPNFEVYNLHVDHFTLYSCLAI